MTDVMQACWDERLVCEVLSLRHDFRRHAGQLFLPEGNGCDMTGCVRMFEAIDPQVSLIDVHVGEAPDTTYRREGAAWKALRRR